MVYSFECIDISELVINVTQIILPRVTPDTCLLASIYHVIHINHWVKLGQGNSNCDLLSRD